MEVTINYNGQAVAVEVTLEVYEFLDRADHKTENLFHEQRRHWDGREFDEYIAFTEGVGVYSETPEEYLCRMETLHQRSVHLLPQLLLLQDFLRGEPPVEGIVFNAILPVQRVVGLVPVHPALIGGIVLLLAPDHGQDFLGHVHKDIGFIHIGIQLPKIDLLHYVPPFRFTG